MILPLPLVKAKRRPHPDPGGGATQGGFTVEAVTKDSHSPGTAPRPLDVCGDPVFRSPHCPLQLLPPGFCSWSQHDFLKKRSVVACPLPGSPVVFPRLLLLHGLVRVMAPGRPPSRSPSPGPVLRLSELAYHHWLGALSFSFQVSLSISSHSSAHTSSCSSASLLKFGGYPGFRLGAPSLLLICVPR